LVRHDLDCIDLLEPYAADEGVAIALRVPLIGTLATAYARANRTQEAAAAMQRALDALDPRCDDDVRARLYQQAAFVFLSEPASGRSREYAGLAVELAESCNLYEVAVRSYSVLFQITYDEADDPISCLSILDRLLEAARKGGSTQARLFGLMASCWIEAERGNETALEGIDAALAATPGGLPRVQAEALLPARALRLAWDRDFAGAYAVLAGTSSRATTDDRRAYRASELALYAFSAGLGPEGEAALEEALGALSRTVRPTRRVLCARLILAIAELARGHIASAHRYLSDVERLVPAHMRRLRAFAHVVRTQYRHQLGQADRPVLIGTLERLRAEHFGGFARLLEAIAFPDSAEGSYASLTSAEREILHLLATGASTKELAVKTGRSPRTIDTHVRAICQKLNCRGRRAAIALATGAGWVHAQS
jgi:DNA-binding CsgD family transcriptional regulator